MVTSTQPVIIQQSHYEKLFSGGSGDFGSNTLSKEWYFSEGYTSGSATDFIFILNPENIASQVKFNIFYDDGSSDTFEQSIPPNSKKTILMNNHVKEYKWYGLKIESNKNILAHQVHYDNTYSAGHGSIGTQIPSDNWYFAEGYNSINNKEYITILNPNQKPVETNFSILYSDGSNKKFSINTKPNSRETVRLDQYVISRADYGIIMKSNLPIITHQVHYDKKYSAGHGSPGVTNIPIIIAKNINENLSKQENKSKTIINKTYFINTTKDRNYTKTTPARNTENSQLSFLVSIIVGLVFIVLAWKRIKGLNCKNKENPKNKKLNKDIAKAVDEKRKKKEEKKKKLAEEERKKKEEEKKKKEAKRKEEEKKQKEAKRKEEEKAEKEKKKESNETKPTKNSEEKKEQPKELEKEEQHKENKEETKKHKKDKEN